ncbi:hypothetical protein RRG08_036903 [Elysia crispata]|uniref:DNA helicase n=1 Tax=Elysia crispata TaxID=231223 RepID=A0AAE0ZI25_9GAST|nr:hypothetical protein RRG08_036903 [Elysia crispata]
MPGVTLSWESINMSYISERLARIQSAVAFLDHSSQFHAIRDRAKELSNLKGCLVYNFNVIVDLGAVYNHDAVLGESILTNPLESASLFQEIVFQFCVSHQLLSLEVTSTQICARLRIVNFPSGCDSLRIFTLANLNKFIDYPGFVTVTGVVVGTSGSAKYTQSTKYVCPETSCEGCDSNHFIRMHIPGASENQTIRNDFRCSFCGNILVEVTSSRTLSDKILVEILPIVLTGPSQNEVFKSGRVQPIPVYVRDELLDVVMLGDVCQVVGITRTDMNGEMIDVTLELRKRRVGTKFQLPGSVQTITEATKYSPWSLPLNMAYRFGDKIVPCGEMIKLRLLLLISLVLNPKRQLLHVLVVGNETRHVMSLCHYALKFSQRSFPAMVGTPLCGKVTSDSHYTWAPYFIHAGILPLCSGGVCFCGDLGPWKKQNREQLQAILSGGKIFFDLTAKHTGGLSQQQTLGLQCHVWGAFSPLTLGSKLTSAMNDIMCGSSTGDLSKSFLDSFSYICFLDGGNSFVDEEINTHTCYLSLTSRCAGDMSNTDLVEVPYEDMDTYVTMARQQEPLMTSAAETLLQSYYTAVRLARSSGLGGSDVPVSGIATLLSLAIGFAKLRLSGQVQETDAVMAAYLYEESLVSRLGLSVLSIQPQPHVSKSFITEFLSKQNDVIMQSFQAQLLKFCTRAFDNRSSWREE